MKDLKFGKALSDGRGFVFKSRKSLPIFFDVESETPYYFQGGDIEDLESFSYSDSLQFEGKPIALAALLEVLDKSSVPIVVRVAGVSYLAAKGFLAHLKDEQVISLILIVSRPGVKTENLSDLKLYISSEAFRNERYKAISKLTMNLIAEYPGSTIISKSINHYFGVRLEIPEFKTIGERKAFLDEVVDSALEELKGE